MKCKPQASHRTLALLAKFVALSRAASTAHSEALEAVS